MGWKASIVLAFREPIHLPPDAGPPDRDRSERLAAALGAGVPTGQTGGLMDNFDPPKGTSFVAVLADAAIIADPRVTARLIEITDQAWLDALAAWPNVLALTLHSTVNLWGFALYQNGRLIRRAAGASDTPSIVDEGTPQPEELGFSVAQHSAGSNDDQDAGASDWRRLPDGEGVVMRMAARALGGERMDDADTDLLDRLTLWRFAPPGLMHRLRALFGGSPLPSGRRRD